MGYLLLTKGEVGQLHFRQLETRDPQRNQPKVDYAFVTVQIVFALIVERLGVIKLKLIQPSLAGIETLTRSSPSNSAARQCKTKNALAGIETQQTRQAGHTATQFSAKQRMPSRALRRDYDIVFSSWVFARVAKQKMPSRALRPYNQTFDTSLATSLLPLIIEVQP